MTDDTFQLATQIKARVPGESAIIPMIQLCRRLVEERARQRAEELSRDPQEYAARLAPQLRVLGKVLLDAELLATACGLH